MARNIPRELLFAPPVPGEWSAMECLNHLLDTERFVFPSRVRALLAGQDFPAFDPSTQGTVLRPDQDAFELAREFAHLREESLSLLERVNETDLARSAFHQELGRVTLGELLHKWAGHDLMHTVQAERAMMQPFIRGCGPWRVYFSDHLIEG
jgi:hypothetical protein